MPLCVPQSHLSTSMHLCVPQAIVSPSMLFCSHSPISWPPCPHVSHNPVLLPAGSSAPTIQSFLLHAPMSPTIHTLLPAVSHVSHNPILWPPCPHVSHNALLVAAATPCQNALRLSRHARSRHSLPVPRGEARFAAALRMRATAHHCVSVRPPTMPCFSQPPGSQGPCGRPRPPPLHPRISHVPAAPAGACAPRAVPFVPGARLRRKALALPQPVSP